MKKTLFLSLLLSTNMIFAQEQPVQDQIQKSNELIKSLGQQLKGKLMHAIQTEGPINAVSICAQEAQKLATEISDKSGDWEIKRVSLKARSTHATPDEWEKNGLQQLDLQNEKKINDDPLVVVQNDASGFRMLKGIKTEAICLTCHGANINENLAKKIKELYPNDMATGYQLNQLRGAFSVRKKLKP